MLLGGGGSEGRMALHYIGLVSGLSDTQWDECEGRDCLGCPQHTHGHGEDTPMKFYWVELDSHPQWAGCLYEVCIMDGGPGSEWEAPKERQEVMVDDALLLEPPGYMGMRMTELLLKSTILTSQGACRGLRDKARRRVRYEPVPYRIYELTRRTENTSRKQMDNNARRYEVARSQGVDRCGPSAQEASRRRGWGQGRQRGPGGRRT